MASRGSDKRRLSLKNNTAGVREREDVNRTREAGNRDEVEGVVAITRNVFRNGAVSCIVWLDADVKDSPPLSLNGFLLRCFLPRCFSDLDLNVFREIRFSLSL